MNILIAMETSGVTRRAFESFAQDNDLFSWNIISCDLLPADDNSANHIIGDAVEVIKYMTPTNLETLEKKWDLITVTNTAISIANPHSIICLWRAYLNKRHWAMVCAKPMNLTWSNA